MQSLRDRRARRRIRRRSRIRRRERPRGSGAKPFAPASGPRSAGGWVFSLGVVIGIGIVAVGAILGGPWLVDRAGDGRMDSVSAEPAAPLALTEGSALEFAPTTLGPARPGEGRSRPGRLPGREAMAEARAYARDRAGVVSFAVIDSRGRMHGLDAARRYVSASVVKAMLLVAELKRLATEGLPLDDGTRSLLSAMITYSDNGAADAIYERVGDAGLFEVARRAGLRDFTVAGYWANAQISARDMATLMHRLDRVLVGPYEDVGAGLMTAIVPEQRWGIPAATPDGWRVRFKGGWRTTDMGQLVHQVARLEQVHSGRRELAIAVLSDGQPSFEYGIETVRGIAERALADLRSSAARHRRPAARPESGRSSSPPGD